MKDRIWTNASRQLLYESLVRKFGPHANWATRHSPYGRKDPRYPSFRAFLEAFNVIVGAKSWKAVGQQLAFGIQYGYRKTPRKIEQHETYYGNGLAALDAGFIK